MDQLKVNEILASDEELDGILVKMMNVSGLKNTTKEQRFSLLFCMRAACPDIAKKLLENKDKFVDLTAA